MSAIWTKICGITRAEDAEAAAKLGADAVGLVLYSRSPRAVFPADCGKILSSLSRDVRRVALFVNPEVGLVQEAMAAGGFDLLQFHGDETESFCLQFDTPYMKAIRVKDYEQAEREILAYPSAEMVLLDRYQENVPGGTGKPFDWTIAARLVAGTNKPVVLAGGLNANNVREAIEQANPFGVDVSSGVESHPGMKDLGEVKRFIESSKSV